MTSVIATIMLGLEPVVFLVGGIYAGTVYCGIVGVLRGAREERVALAPAFVRSHST